MVPVDVDGQICHFCPQVFVREQMKMADDGFLLCTEQGFVKNSYWVSHQPELYLPQLILT